MVLFQLPFEHRRNVYPNEGDRCENLLHFEKQCIIRTNESELRDSRIGHVYHILMNRFVPFFCKFTRDVTGASVTIIYI